MKPVVVRNIERADADADRRRSADLASRPCTRRMGRTGLMKPYMRPIWPGAQIAGRAVTVLAQPGDNWMIHVAVEQCQTRRRAGGRPAPPTTPTACSASCWRPRCGRAACVGLVIDAGCRDVAALKEMGFPVWSRAISAKGTVKATLGAVNVPVVCAGAHVNPGDVVVADDDGVVVVPAKAGRRCRGEGPEARGRRRRQARRSSPPACSASTCTTCASRWRKPG